MQNNYHLRYFSNFQRFASVHKHSSLYCNIGAFVFYAAFGPIQIQSTITEKMTAVHFPSNALRSKIFESKWMSFESLTQGRRSICSFCQNFLSSGDLVSSLFSNFKLTLAMHPGKTYMPACFP